MPLVPALCTQCGGLLEIESTQEAAVCPFCNTPFITEKAINNYNTTNVTNIGNLHADVVKISDEHSIDNRVRSGDTFIKLEDYESAKSVFDSLIKECPYDHRSWLGMTKVLSKNYTDFDIDRQQLSLIENLHSNAQKVADSNENIGNTCKQYIEKVKCDLDLLAQQTEMNIKLAKEAYDSKIKEHINTINETHLKIRKKKYPSIPINITLVAITIIMSLIGFAENSSDGIILLICLGVLSFCASAVLRFIWVKACEGSLIKLNNNIANEKSIMNKLTDEFWYELDGYDKLLEKATGEAQDHKSLCSYNFD